MSSMVEKVARAICEINGYNPEYPVSVTKVQWETFTETARAAIEAMREPTKEMLMSGVTANVGPRSTIHGYIYSAMIDAALRED